MANKTLFALMFLCSYALVPCILGLESVVLVALWLNNPFNQLNPRLMNYLRAYKALGRPTLCPLIRLQIKVRPKGLHSFAFSILIFEFSLLPSTTVENSLQISSFMQNKPNFLDALMNVTSLITADYENIANCKLCKNKPNTNPIKANTNPIKANTNPIKANTKPIKANKMPKQTQYKPNQTQFQRQKMLPRMKINPRRKSLGYYADEIEAPNPYDRAVVGYWLPGGVDFS